MINFRVTAPLAALGALALCSCGGSKTVNWDAACQGNAAGTGCLTLHVSVSPAVYSNTANYLRSGNLSGNIMWALYNPSDVSDQGPAATAVVLDAGSYANADLNASGATLDIVITNVPPQQYKALILLDQDGNHKATAGESASNPGAAFDVPADVHTTWDIALDIVSPITQP